MTNQKQAAFTKAYSTFQERFTRYCATLAYGKMEIEDLVKDVLLGTYGFFEQIQQKEQLLHYLLLA